MALMADEVTLEPDEGAWELDVVFHIYRKTLSENESHKLQGDIDNLIKSILDTIQGEYYIHDDKQIVTVTAEKQWSTVDGVCFTLRKITDAKH